MIKTIRYWIIKVMGVSKGETNALLILVPILLLAIIVPPFFRGNLTNRYSNHATDQALLDSLLAQLERNKEKVTYSKNQLRIIIHETFDPNTATQELLEVNGIPNYIAKRIISYREKGGKFRELEDIQRIYGMNEQLYESLVPYIKIKASQKAMANHSKYTINKNKKFTIIPFDINKADTSDFKQIRGIGSKLSYRLVNFRNKLGGFVSTDQLYQVYGLEQHVVDSMLKYGSISNRYIPSQIKINSDTIKHLSRHPYINYQLANAIVNYKRQHGKFTELDQLKKIHLMSDTIYYKLFPYLTTD